MYAMNYRNVELLSKGFGHIKNASALHHKNKDIVQCSLKTCVCNQQLRTLFLLASSHTLQTEGKPLKPSK